MKNTSRGFSLIEISIVLSIVGILMSFTIKGRGLIELAKIRSVIAQVDSYRSAIDTFTVKYGGFPGDIKDATTIIGNGAQGGNFKGGISNDDIKRFWDNLIKSGLITASIEHDFPTTKLGGELLLCFKNGKKWLVLCATGSKADNLQGFLSKETCEKIIHSMTGSTTATSGDESVISQHNGDKYYIMFRID